LVLTTFVPMPSLRIRHWALLMAASLAGVSASLSRAADVNVQAGAGPSASGPGWSVPSVLPPKQWSRVPRVLGRLQSKDLGLLINTEDPYSVRVGEAYVKARGLKEDQVLRVSLPVKSSLTREEFAELSGMVDRFFGDRVQALALSWRLPYGVECNSITGALAMGFDPGLCSNTCAVSRTSPYFASASTRPYQDFKMRIAMMLAAPSVDSAKALIERGVKSDGTLGLKGSPVANVHLVTTSDGVRSVRRTLFPPAGPVPEFNLDVQLDDTNAVKNASRVLMYLTGITQVESLDTIQFLPGALADHLTSFGGVLDKPHGQMTVLSWIDAGATASYGTASEPCAHLQKFPHPQGLILFYAQGATAIETYWKSVAWPQQGLFVGEPLAAPFDRGLPAKSADGSVTSVPGGVRR
jgi:uncharacterized protein (TIGR03790 family)